MGSMTPQLTGGLLCGLLSFMFALGIVGAGLVRVLATLVVAVIALFALEAFSDIASSQSLLEDIAASVAGLVIGFLFGRIGHIKSLAQIKEACRLAIHEILSDWRILVVFIAILVAALITILFAHLRVDEKTPLFWHGFYEAWTASIVFFAILGVAGTIVSLYRPEKDAFEAKVRILCGGRTGTEVDYIRENITKVGYFSESVARTYTILNWDPDRKAYEIEVTHESVNKNFFDDDASDSGRFGVKPDPLTPPLDPVGRLIEVNVDGKQVFGAEDIPVTGILKEWSVPLRKGGEVHILLRHRAWYDVAIEHLFRPARFAKTVTVTLRSELPNAKPRFNAVVYQRETVDFRRGGPGTAVQHRKELEPSVNYEHIPTAKNCLPDLVAFQLKLEPP